MNLPFKINKERKEISLTIGRKLDEECSSQIINIKKKEILLTMRDIVNKIDKGSLSL